MAAIPLPDTQDDLLSALYNLSLRMNQHGGKLDESMLERYQYFKTHSERGEDCVYAKKCRALFVEFDYEDTKKLFLETLELYRQTEGDRFGR